MHYSNIFKIRFLNKDESWDLLCGNVFAKKLCPPQLEKVGKKIAENCEGLPLLIVTVADLLTKAEKTPECWNKVAESKESSIFVDAYDQIAKVLYPSYNFLPQYLKACFLYMGAFPENYEVRCSKLINLWSAEGLLEPNPSQSLEDFAVECFQELVFSNLVVVRKESRSSDRVKACNLHAIYRHLCKKEAGNKRFLHILNSYADGFAEDIESQRRICIYKNILLSIKDVYNSMASISTVRSLLCFGTYHQYQVPICFSLRLLRVLDALTIRFYEFPIEVVKLVQLKYFALTYNGKLPLSISKLWNLQYLIVYQHLSIKSSVAESYLPMEIWDLQELKYLEIMGRNLPDPPPGAVLRNLLTLLDVGTHSCTKGVLQSIPNLEKLRVQIELAVDSDESFRCFDHISYLCELKSLKCAVMNPKLRSEIVAPISPLPVFTSRLQNLTLSGFGYPWKYMSKIAKLPFLQALKLQCYGFQGENWKVEEKGFLKLKYLIIEDTDLVQWTVGDKSFPLLRFLIIKNCYKLKEIPTVYSLLRIELVDCNPSAVTCAKRMEAIYVHVYANSSWDDGNLKS